MQFHQQVVRRGNSRTQGSRYFRALANVHALKKVIRGPAAIGFVLMRRDEIEQGRVETKVDGKKKRNQPAYDHEWPEPAEQRPTRVTDDGRRNQ